MKKVSLGILMAVVILMLAGCTCSHKETQLINAVAATCQEEGYSGDTYCVKCEKVISQGHSLDVLQHSQGSITDAREASCTEEGYTGDIYCIECGECLEYGETIDKIEHTQGSITDAREASCTEEGYTGDIYCIECGERLECGETIDKIEHTVSDPQDFAESSCCTEGYTGNKYCLVCGQLIEIGETIPMLPHTFGDAVGTIEATCLQEGYTGDRVCSVCGEIDYGEKTPTKTHVFENNRCTVCDWLAPGLYINGEQMMTWQGLIDGGYVKTDGNKLVNCVSSLIGTLVVGEEITELEGDDDNFIYGKVSPFYGLSELECVYLPKGISSLGTFWTYGTFGECTKLHEVRAFGTLTDVGYENTFKNCAALEEFEIPDGTVKIGEGTFSGCTSLKSVRIPDSVRVIEKNAFYGTRALQSIELPEGLEILEDAFGGSGVKSVVLPSTVTSMSSHSLEYIDASACSWETISDRAFAGSLSYGAPPNSLKKIDLPPTLKSIKYGAFDACNSLETLVLPDGFETLKDNSPIYSPFDGCDALVTIVWPVSLVNGTKLGPSFCPNLKTIYYRGSEFQWSLTTSKDLFEGVEIIFNYSGE